MANPFEVRPVNILQALLTGVEGYESAQKRTKQAEEDAVFKDIGQKMQAGGAIDNNVIGRILGLGRSGAPMLAAVSQLGKADTTDELKEYKFDMAQRAAKGLAPVGFGDWKTGLKQAGATKITNSIQTGDNAYQKQLGEDDAKRFIDFQKSGRSATGTIGSLNRMETLTSDPNFYSGTGGEALVLPFRQAVGSLGGDPKAAQPMEEFRALSSKAALDGMGGSLGTGFSNADRDFIVNQYPNLANTQEGNKARIEGLRKIEQRKIDIAKLARDYASKNKGRLDAGFDDELAAWAEKNPLFPRSASPSMKPSQSKRLRFNPATGTLE